MLSYDWRALRRRWPIVVLGLLATIALCWAATVVVPARNVITANVLMLPPRFDRAGQAINPYLNMGGLESVTDITVRKMTDQETAEAVRSLPSDAEFDVIRDITSAGPIVLVTVDSSSEEEALATQGFLVKRLPEQLAQLQEDSGAAERNMVTATLLTQDKTPDIVRKGTIRALLVAFVGGIAMTYLSVALIDGLLLARQRRVAHELGPDVLAEPPPLPAKIVDPVPPTTPMLLGRRRGSE